jgi:hypothetical protein
VQPAAGGKAGYMAVCTVCGWTGRIHELPAAAERDCEMHEDEHSP